MENNAYLCRKIKKYMFGNIMFVVFFTLLFGGVIFSCVFIMSCIKKYVKDDDDYNEEKNDSASDYIIMTSLM